MGFWSAILAILVYFWELFKDWLFIFISPIFKPEILHPGSIQSYRLHIFNRWGNKIFESTSPEIGWNGLQSGELCAPGVYVYVIDIDQVDGKNQVNSGTLNLIR